MSRLVELHWPTGLVLAACAGLASGHWWRPPPATLAALAVVSLVVGLGSASWLRLAALGLVVFTVGLWWAGLRADALDRTVLGSRLGETSSARVVVTGSARRTRYSIRVRAVVHRFGDEVVRERVLLQLPLGRAPPQGAVLELRARPVEPRGPETGFDERGWLEHYGIHVVLEGRDPRIVGRRGGIGGVADRLRAHVERTLSSGTRGERRAVLAGIVLGSDDGLDDELRTAFRASGLTHLLAVSGQNVAITALGTVAIARAVGIGRIIGEAIAIAAVLAYALAVGWEPSVVRAAVAGVIASSAWILARPRDRWHAMAIGALVLLAWSPATIVEPGFQLSFAAVAAMFLALPPAMRVVEGYPVHQKLAELSIVALVCGLATAPIVWLHFGAVALWTIPANVLAEPAMPPLIALALLSAAIAPFAPAVSLTLAWMAGLCGAWITFVARLVSTFPAAQIRSPWAMAALGACVATPFAVWIAPRWRRRQLVGVLLALGAAAALAGWIVRDRPTWSPPAGLRVTFLDVGQGDATLLEVPGGAVLVDQGVPEADVAGQLRKVGIRSLSAIVMTHPENDHIGGAEAVLERLSVGMILDPGQIVVTERHEAALRVAREKRIPVVVVRSGDRFAIGRLTLRVLWPDGPGAPSGNPNDHAIVLLATYRDTDVLLTADAESNVTGRLPLRPVEILKVAHHGSEDTGLADELRILHPSLAVISVGADNDYGHPRPETLAALSTSPGLRVVRTDRDGRIVIESDGHRLRVATHAD